MSIVPLNVGTVSTEREVIEVLSKSFLQNTCSITLLIGEKAAMIIAEDLGIDYTARPSW
jgi:alcohol oxidase